MKPRFYKRRRLLNGFFKVDEFLVSPPKEDGGYGPRRRLLVLDRGDAVGVLLIKRETRKVVMIRQFRFAAYPKTDGWLTEIVAGMIDHGESPEETARRETMEEAGYEIGALQHITNFFPSPGGSSERIFLFAADVTEHDLRTQGGGVAAEGEDIRIVELTFDEVRQMAERGEIQDAKSLIAIQWLLARLSATGRST